MKTKTILTALLLCITASTRAEIPAGYYNSLNGKSQADLKNAIHNLVGNFTQVSSYNALPEYFQKTDVYPQSNRWWDMYSDILLYAPSFKGLNREHSFPKSWWGGLTTVPAYVDLNHLYPSEADANMAKSNYPLGEVSATSTPKFDNGITKVGYPTAGQGGGAQYVFEPDDEYKGDFARTYMYMATCYQNLTWKYTYMVSQNTYPTLNTWSVNLLMKWHRQDPVSEKEKLRNDAVYKIQNNRNPFIDYPELAELLWGTRVGQAFDLGQAGIPTGDPNLITPVQDMSLDFGQVALGSSVTSRLWFNGEYLNAPVDLTVYTGDKAMFAIPVKSIAANLINADNGYWLTVTYTPTALGQHTSRLLISGGGVTGSRGIALRGECLAVPTLTAPVATAATGIESTQYVARWTPAPEETVDYYEVQRTQYTAGQASQTTLLAEADSLVMDGFDRSEREAYSVRSVRLGHTSAWSNTVFVEHAAVSDVLAGTMPLAIQTWAGGLRFDVTQPHTGAVITDAAGRRVTVLDRVDSDTVVNLMPGLYIITTRECPQPVKALVR